MMNREKNRILKLHREVLLEGKFSGIGKGGTNTSSSGQFDGNAFEGEGPLSVSGRQKDIGVLPDEVDITKGSKGFMFEPKITFITGPGDDNVGIGKIPPHSIGIDYPVSPKEDEDEIVKPLSLSCCKKCDNGMYTNKCFPLDSEEDEDCRFPTLEICEDESDNELPSLFDIFS